MLTTSRSRSKKHSSSKRSKRVHRKQKVNKTKKTKKSVRKMRGGAVESFKIKTLEDAKKFFKEGNEFHFQFQIIDNNRNIKMDGDIKTYKNDDNKMSEIFNKYL